MSKRDYSKSRLKIFASFYGGHMRLFMLDMLCALLMAVIDLAFPMLSRYALNTLLPNDMFTMFFVLIGMAFFVGERLDSLATGSRSRCACHSKRSVADDRYAR